MKTTKQYAERQAVTEWKNWNDVFTSTIVIPSAGLSKFSAHSLPERTAHTWKLADDREKYGKAAGTPMYLSRFCSLRRVGGERVYLDVTPTTQAIEAVERNAIFVEYDTMNFEAIEWKDGRALIVCRNSKIIGGPWVAKIDASTIPTFERI